MIFHMYNTNVYTKQWAIYWYKAFNSFSDEKKIRTLRILSRVTFLSHFIKKASVEAIVNIAAICTQHFVRNCSQFDILWQLRRLDWFVNKLFGTWYTLSLLLCPFISESDSSVVKSSLRNPWIWGSNPGGTILPFQYHVEWIPFPPKTVHFVPLSNIPTVFNVPLLIL